MLSCHYLEGTELETAEAAADRMDGGLNARKSLEVVLSCKLDLLLYRDLSSGSSAMDF